MVFLGRTAESVSPPPFLSVQCFFICEDCGSGLRESLCADELGFSRIGPGHGRRTRACCCCWAGDALLRQPSLLQSVLCRLS